MTDHVAQDTSPVKARAEALRADFDALTEKGRRFATELWTDLRKVARGGVDLAQAWVAERRGKPAAGSTETRRPEDPAAAA